MQLLVFFLCVVIFIETLLLLFLLPRKNISREARLRQKEYAQEQRAERASKKPAVKTPLQQRQTEAASKPLPSVPAEEEIAPLFQDRGRIAIVIDDCGYGTEHLDTLRRIHVPLTLAILPFLDYSKEIAEFAHRHNFEVIIHMPMEPKNKEGLTLEPQTLMTSMSRGAVERIMAEAFDELVYARGINNHMGSKATEDEVFMGKVFGFLKKKDMFFLDSFVTPKSVCSSLAFKRKIKFARRAIFLDNSSRPESIKKQLYALASRAERLGAAIGIGHDRENTLQILQQEIPVLQEKGYRFVFVSELAE